MIRTFTAAHARVATAAGAAMVVVVVVMCLLAWWAGRVAKVVATGGSLGTLSVQLGIGIGLMAILSVAAAGRDLALARLSGAFSSAMRAAMLTALIRRPVAAVRAQSSADAVTRLGSDIALLHHALLRTLAIWLPNVVTTIVLLGAVIVTSPFLALVTALLIVPVLVVTSRSSARLHDAVRDSQERVARLGALIADALAGVREAKVFRREAAIEQRSREMSDAIFAHTLREEQIALTVPSVVTFVAFVGACGLVLAAAWQFQQGGLDGPDLTRFLVLLAMLAGPLQESARSSSAVTRFRALLHRCQEVLDSPREPEDDRQPTDALAPDAIRLEGIRVGYPSTGFALGPIDLTIAQGETVALVGPSGAGKSTLLELIPHLVVPTSGRLSFVGPGDQSPTLGAIRGACAYVPQEPYFFEGTIRDNLLFAAPHASAGSIAAVCAAAHVREFVQRLPGGCDAPIARGALNLSVGQRQRLAIARAMLVDPRILLLDEPTASLDEESEQLLIAALRTFCRGRITILITHRPAMLTLADRVVTLRNGQIERIVIGGQHASTAARHAKHVALP
ncbi:MAG: ABC transporter ATP-binding protein [Gemmatimonadaceae bacterium]